MKAHLSCISDSNTDLNGDGVSGSFGERDQPPAWDIKMLYDGTSTLLMHPGPDMSPWPSLESVLRVAITANAD